MISQRLALVLAVLSVAAIGAVMVMAFYVIGFEFVYWQVVLRDHFAVIVGLPSAAVTSFVLVVFLRQTEGPVEFEGLGFKLRGAAGQITLWVVCFLAMAAAIRLCW